MLRKCSRAGSAITISLFTSSRDIPQAWKQLIPPDHFLHPDHLSLYESMHLPDLSYVYALLTYRGEAIGAAYFQVLRVQKEHLDLSRLKPVTRFVAQSSLSLLQPGMVIAGHLFRHDVETFFYKRTVPLYDAFRGYKQAIRAVMEKYCSPAVVVKDMPQALVPYFQNHAPRFLALRNDVSMQLSIPGIWKDLSDYERALKHKYAQRFRNIRRSWSLLQLQELSAAEVAGQADRLFELYRQVSDRQQVRLGTLSRDFLPVLKQSSPEAFRLWTVSERETPIAFFSAWERKDVLDMFYIGLDYTRNAEYNLYFNILFSGLEKAIELGKGKIILGRTALEAKARLGGKPAYLSTFIYIRNPLLRGTLLRYQQGVMQEEEWENRHPFKQGPAS